MSSLCVCDLCHNYFPKNERHTHKGNSKHGTIDICSYCHEIFKEVRIGTVQGTSSLLNRDITRIDWDSYPPPRTNSERLSQCIITMANGSSRRFGSSSTVGSLKVSSSSSRKSATCCVQGCKAVARDGLVCGKHKAVANQRLDKTTEGEGTFWDEMIGLLEDEDPMSHYAGAAASSHVENPMRIPLTATSPNNGSRKVSSRRPFALEEDEAAAIAAGGAGDADGSSGYGSQQIHEVAQSLRLAMMGVQALHAQMQEHETKAQFYPKLVEENEALKHQLQLEQAKASVGGSVDDDVAERLVNLERENEEAKLVIQQLKTALEEAAARERVLKHDQDILCGKKVDVLDDRQIKLLTDIYTRGLESIRNRREAEAVAANGLQTSLAADLSDASPYVSPQLTGASAGMSGAGAIDGAALLKPGEMDLYGTVGSVGLPPVQAASAGDNAGAMDYISGLDVGKLLSEQQAKQELLRQHGTTVESVEGLGYGNGGGAGAVGLSAGGVGAGLVEDSAIAFDDSEKEGGKNTPGEQLIQELSRTVNCHWEGDTIVMNEFGIRVLPPYTAYDCQAIGNETTTSALERAQKIVQGCRANLGL